MMVGLIVFRNVKDAKELIASVMTDPKSKKKLKNRKTTKEKNPKIKKTETVKN
jgi:hypothetical protein